MKYIVTGQITISVYTEVEANDARRAKKLALEQPMMSLCNQCASAEGRCEWVTSGELDGEVTNIRAEPA